MKKWKERKKEIGTKNHKKVVGKLLRTDKQFRHLKQQQKETISTWLYEEYRRLWIEKGQEPHKRNNREIVAAVMERIEAAGIWLPEQWNPNFKGKGILYRLCQFHAIYAL